MKITVEIEPEEAVQFLTALTENMQKLVGEQLTKVALPDDSVSGYPPFTPSWAKSLF